MPRQHLAHHPLRCTKCLAAARRVRGLGAKPWPDAAGKCFLAAATSVPCQREHAQRRRFIWQQAEGLLSLLDGEFWLRLKELRGMRPYYRASREDLSLG